MATPIVYILHFAVLIGLALLTLLATLRWPAVRGKHVLCAAFALILGGHSANAVYLLMVVRGATPGDRLLEALEWLSRLSSALSALLLLVFAVVMGAELRQREVDQLEP